MPFLAPPPTAEVRPLCGPDETPLAQGTEGRTVQDQILEMLRHWRDRSEYHAATESSEGDALDYTIVPLDAAGSVAVRYKYAGELQPLPYQPDE